MRLLFVHDRFGAMAGAEVNLHLTAAEFKARGHAIGIVHGPSTGNAEAAWNTLFPYRLPLNGLGSQKTVRTGIHDFQPDALYVHKMSDLDVLKALAEGGRPVARMVHDHDLYCLRSYKYFPLSRRICTLPAGPRCVFPCGGVLARNRDSRFPFKWRSYWNKLRELRLNRRFDRLVVATDYMKQQLLRNRFDPRRIEIHAPVPRSAPEACQSAFTDRNLVVYSGQVIRGKGVDVLLEALARVRVPVTCSIVGDGHHRSHCEALSRRLGLGDRVTFHGYLPPNQLANYYAEASVAAVSSVWPEPFGAVGLEAMRHGVPVVAFDAGGIKEWLHDGRNGFLVPWMDVSAFAARIEQLLCDKTLARRLGAHGRERALAEFDFDRYITGLETMFARLAAGRTAVPA